MGSGRESRGVVGSYPSISLVFPLFTESGLGGSRSITSRPSLGCLPTSLNPSTSTGSTRTTSTSTLHHTSTPFRFPPFDLFSRSPLGRGISSYTRNRRSGFSSTSTRPLCRIANSDSRPLFWVDVELRRLCFSSTVRWWIRVNPTVGSLPFGQRLSL